jgi:hypothetical protein
MSFITKFNILCPFQKASFIKEIDFIWKVNIFLSIDEIDVVCIGIVTRFFGILFRLIQIQLASKPIGKSLGMFSENKKDKVLILIHVIMSTRFYHSSMLLE